MIAAISLRTIERPSSTPIPGLASSWSAPEREREVDADLGGALGLAARAAEVGDDAVRAAVEHGVDDVVDRAEVGRLDLDHVGGVRAVEGADVVDACWPIRRRRAARSTRRAASSSRSAHEVADLRRAAARVDRVLDAQGVRVRPRPPSRR